MTQTSDIQPGTMMHDVIDAYSDSELIAAADPCDRTPAAEVGVPVGGRVIIESHVIIEDVDGGYDAVETTVETEIPQPRLHVVDAATSATVTTPETAVEPETETAPEIETAPEAAEGDTDETDSPEESSASDPEFEEPESAEPESGEPEPSDPESESDAPESGETEPGETESDADPATEATATEDVAVEEDSAAADSESEAPAETDSAEEDSVENDSEAADSAADSAPETAPAESTQPESAPLETEPETEPIAIVSVDTETEPLAIVSIDTEPIRTAPAGTAAPATASTGTTAPETTSSGTTVDETEDRESRPAEILPFAMPSTAVVDEHTAQLIVEKSQVAGSVVDDPEPRVRFRRMSGFFGTAWIWLLSLLTLTLSVSYAVWLIRSGPPIDDRVLRAASLAASMVIIATLTIEVLRLLLITMLTISSAQVRAPVPVKPHRNLKAALFITFVPSSESLSMLEETLTAARALEAPRGTEASDVDEPPLVDVFVLDEGDPDNPDLVQNLVDRLNASGPGNRVRRISRLGIDRFNEGPKFAAKTKHGNVNAAYTAISENPDLPRYDLILGLDPDHVPMPEFTTRVFGYFNDPDVAFVAAPQAYANSTVDVVPKLAESQQFVFHSLIQTAANSFGGAMLVGTNYAIRTSVFEQIGGAQASITEDLATGLEVLDKRNPETGARWRAVYTPDVLAHGEGPNTWGAYFKQQNRWATGAIRHVIAGPFFLHMLRSWHSPRRVMHYLLLMSFYPVMALTWVFGAMNSVLFALFGESGTRVDPQHWVLFYTWTTVLQITVFIAARRYNVSPYESANSWGVYGMFMSVSSAPIYVVALFKSLTTSNPTFDVTPKGGSSVDGDSLFTFRWNLLWAALYVWVIGQISFTGHAAVATLVWPVLALLLSVAPVLIWYSSVLRHRRAARETPAESDPETPGDPTTTASQTPASQPTPTTETAQP
ncbi:MAG: glycosyltransferase family 2 protein [Gordonia sp. (in: high G+C Gram-positive bacteria)]|uniref:glycosyltransferase family 2 protein n=1 Tax=Gordonia sp. (in: high G+C Gram-positive bacteria) TaxID=84139 RepID=UPI0039E50D36